MTEPAAEGRVETVGRLGDGADPDVWEVFREEKEGDPMRHAGNLRAPDAELAMHASTSSAGRSALLYCHDTFGLGHLRRTLSVAGMLAASTLVDAQLVVTGSSVEHRFGLPPSTDIIKLPSVVKIADDRYEARSLPVGFAAVRALRRELILGAARTFRPDLVIVDHAPAGCGGEILPALQHLKRTQPGTKLVLGLRDIVDDPARVRAAWARDGIHELLDELYDLIVVYGEREVHDVVAAYGFSDRAAARTRYVGYLRREAEAVPIGEIRARHGLDTERVALVTAGGGGDGHGLFRAVLRAIRAGSAPPDVGWLFVGGPLMPVETWHDLRDAAASLPQVRVVDFLPDLPAYLRGADLAIAMGGYNTVCEILAAGCRAIIVPRVQPRTEQLIRAESLTARGLLRMVHPDQLDDARFLREVRAALDGPAPRGIARLDGLPRMAAELTALLDDGHPLAVPA